MYVALRGNQTCKIYNQCAANRINCGSGYCLNSTSPTCACQKPFDLVMLSPGQSDCICSSVNYSLVNGLCVPRPDLNQGRREEIFVIGSK